MAPNAAVKPVSGGLPSTEQLRLVSDVLRLSQGAGSEAGIKDGANGVGLWQSDVVNISRILQDEVARIGVNLHLVAALGLEPRNLLLVEPVVVVVLSNDISAVAGRVGGEELFDEF